MGLIRTIPPLVSPVTPAEAAKHLSLVDGENDSHVRLLVEAATECAEWTTWRALITQTWELTLDAFPCRLWIPRPPLQSLEIKYIDTNGDEQTLDPAEYKIASGEPAYVVPAYGKSWPSSRSEPGAVRVTFVAGYGAEATAVPQRIRQAILLLAGNWFVNRESVTVGAGAAMELPQSATWLLEAFKTGAAAEWFFPDG